MADLSRMEDLTLKRLLGEITPEEDNELEALARASEENRQFINRMSTKAFHKRQRSLKRTDYDRLDRLTKQKIGNIPGVLEWVPTNPKERNLLPYSIGVAASILLIAGVALWFSRGARTSKTAANYPIKATLRWQPTFGNGSETGVGDSIVLGDIEEGKAYKAGAMRIARAKNELFITLWPDRAAAGTDTLAYHLRIYGKENAQLFLGERIRTQLPPSSSLSFSSFPGDTILRENWLSCDGEVLFDIRPDPQTPTVVKTRKQTITVLGTFFGVRDYNTEDTGAVFCYTGKVSVKDLDNTTRTLFASQRVTVEPGHELKVSTGDFPEAHWSSEELCFNFSNMELNSAMNEIASWYGLAKVRYQGEIDTTARGVVYTGKLSRYLTPQQLVVILDRNDLHFSIQDGAILVRGSTNRPSHSH